MSKYYDNECECPYCFCKLESYDVYGKPIYDNAGGQVHYDIECPKCGKSFCEIYRMVYSITEGSE